MLEIEKDTDFHAYGKAGNFKKKLQVIHYLYGNCFTKELMSH